MTNTRVQRRGGGARDVGLAGRGGAGAEAKAGAAVPSGRRAQHDRQGWTLSCGSSEVSIDEAKAEAEEARAKQAEAANAAGEAAKAAAEAAAEAARAAAEAAREKEIVRVFADLKCKALQDPFPLDLPSGEPNQGDWELIRAWMDTDQSIARDSEEQRLLSARLAERALADFYTIRGSEVQDVSVLQVSSPSSGEWKDFDLKVDGRPVDVKNARRAENGFDRYVSHCVARFKETRHLGAVTIAGVLSEWLPLERMSSGGTRALFLGETTQNALQTLQVAFRDGPVTLVFREPGRRRGKVLLPPWIFEYPPTLYKCRDEAFVGLRAVPRPDWGLCEQAGLQPVATLIAVNRTDDIDSQWKLSQSQTAFLGRLGRRRQPLGLSRSLVFLTVLEHFLCELTRATTSDYSPDEYTDLLFPSGDTTRPLFLSDPLKTIASLIGCLRTLWDERTSGLRGFRVFQLQDLNVLRAKRGAADTKWLTLLAYCGGWIEKPASRSRRPCGTSPLVFGLHQSCSCGRLICPNCGSCSGRCSRSDAGPSVAEVASN